MGAYTVGAAGRYRMRKAKVDNFSKEELTNIVENSRTLQEVLGKLGYSSESGANRKTVQSRLDKYNISTEHFTFGVGKRTGERRTEENVFTLNSTCGQAVLRRWFLKREEVPYCCSICGLKAIWNDQPLSLTLDHINGNNKDNRLENLRWVCPNCDRQLKTFGSKNKRTWVSVESGETSGL